MKNTWYQLSPYGTFDHPQGKQMILPADAKRCVRQTQTFAFKLGLKKIPVYIGHPDDPHFQSQPEHMNKNIYGRVKQLRADKQGLWVQIAWTGAGRELIANQHYGYLSPRWLLEESANAHCYHPIQLLSVGLTQSPNLPVQSILPLEPQPTHAVHSTQLRSKKESILRFTQKVHQRMQSTGESYPEAWHHIYQETQTI